VCLAFDMVCNWLLFGDLSIRLFFYNIRYKFAFLKK
jgi:hypothetical protein